MIKLFKTTNNGGDWAAFRKDNINPAHWIKDKCDIWWVESGYNYKDEVKAAGFTFHWAKKKWFTHELNIAAKLGQFAVDFDLREELTGIRTNCETSLEKSRAVSTNKVLLHPEGLEYMPFQCVGIEYMLNRLGT